MNMAAYKQLSNAVFQGQHMMFSLFRQLFPTTLQRSPTAACTLSTVQFFSCNNVSQTSRQLDINNVLRRELSTAASSGVSQPTSATDPSTEVCAGISEQFDPLLVDSFLQGMNGDDPISDMPNPYVKEHRRCFLCQQDVKLDHKNVRLLSQFVSPYTGRIYGRAVTGLCIPMQKHVARIIKRSRKSGYMPFILKDPRYLQDPQPFDPMAQRKVQ